MKSKCYYQSNLKKSNFFKLEIKIPLSVKLLLLIIFTGSISFASSSYSQEVTVSLDLKNKTIEEVLNKIEKQTDFQFYYNSKLIDINRKISIKSSDEKLSSTLNKVFSNSNISYEIVGRDVILSLIAGLVESDQKKEDLSMITGFVSDTEGKPLIGVTVRVKESDIGVITDIDGRYNINLSDKNVILQFSYVGYNVAEERVGSRKIINVVLTESAEQLEEVVVVAYGVQKKESVVGAISTVSPGKLKVGTTRSISNNLAGSVSGIIGVQRSGEPGYDNSNFWIRGISTFQGARNPLVLVDGIERSLNNIEPEEIETFSVLKDAAASAVYGVRGANGVVLITTKRGKIGKPTISLRSEYAVTQPVKLPEYIGAAEHMELLDEIRIDNNLTPFYTDHIQKTRVNYDPDLYPDIDWIDAITKDNASNFRTTLDISGGSERLRYSFVAAYYGENGILERDKRNEWDSSIKVKRYNLRSNVDMNLTPSTLMRFNIGGYLQDRTAPPQGIQYLFFEAFVNPPFVHPTEYSTGQIPNTGQSNPWARTTQTGFTRNSASKIETLFSLEQDLKFFIPGLKAKGVFSFDRYSSNSVTRSNKVDYYNIASGRNEEGELILSLKEPGSNFLGYSTGSEWGDKSIYLEGSLNYTKTFDLHALDAMFLYNQRNYDSGAPLPYRNQGIAGRASYIYDSKYIAEFNFGYNGSENFAKGKRYGFFPSGAVGWIVSEEDFMRSIQKSISKLKLRASYGLVGNDQLQGRRFAYLPTIESVSGYAWGVNKDYGMGGFAEGHFSNPSLTWETVTKINLGVELGLFENTVEIQLDYFDETRREIFMERKSIPTTAGFIQPIWSNFGKVNNNGIEASLNVNKQFSNKLFGSFFGTLTYAKNKILEIDEPYTVIGTNRAETGHPVGQWFGLVSDGLFSEDDFVDVNNGILAPGIPIHTFGNVRPGDIKYKDLNEDGRIDPLDKTAIKGTLDPQIVYGFGVNLQYSDFDFGFIFQGNDKTYNMLGKGVGYFIPGSGNGATGNIFTNVTDRWTKDNPDNDVFYPRLSQGTNANNSQESSWWLKDMSLLRMKNIEIGYSLPNKIKRVVFLNNARLFLRGNNLLTFTNFKLWDPEISLSHGGQYPIMKSVSMGVEIGF